MKALKKTDTQQLTPFEEGERDARNGYNARANPYRLGSIEYQRWRSGWNYANVRQDKRKAA